MQKFYRLSVNIVKILTLLLAVFLFIGSFLTTCYAENMETQQVLLRFDNPLWNLLELAGYGLLFACCLSLSGKAGAKFRRGLLVFTLGLSCFWVGCSSSSAAQFLLRTPYLYTMLPLNGSLEIKILSTPLSLICPIIHSRSA